MSRTRWILMVSLWFVGCAAHEAYPPALPVKPHLDLSEPFILNNPPPESLRWQDPPRVHKASLTAEEWERYRPQASPIQRKKGRGGQAVQGPMGTNVSSTPNATNTVGGMLRYLYVPDTVYTIPVTIDSLTYLMLPPGELPTAGPALNTDEKSGASAFFLGAASRGTKESYQGVIGIRALFPKQKPSTTAIFFKNETVLFLKIVTVEDSPVVSVSWDFSLQPRPEPEVPVAQRPPKLDMARIFTNYDVKVTSKYPPPWLPTEIFDDGTQTLIRLPADAIKGTRLPGVSGITQTGSPALVQAHLWTTPDGENAMLVVHGLWPALTLKDGAGLTVKIVRDMPQPDAPAAATKGPPSQAPFSQSGGKLAPINITVCPQAPRQPATPPAEAPRMQRIKATQGAPFSEEWFSIPH